jgi:hypothetical protein
MVRTHTSADVAYVSIRRIRQRSKALVCREPEDTKEHYIILFVVALLYNFPWRPQRVAWCQCAQCWAHWHVFWCASAVYSVFWCASAVYSAVADNSTRSKQQLLLSTLCLELLAATLCALCLEASVAWKRAHACGPLILRTCGRELLAFGLHIAAPEQGVVALLRNRHNKVDLRQKSAKRQLPAHYTLPYLPPSSFS